MWPGNSYFLPKVVSGIKTRKTKSSCCVDTRSCSKELGPRRSVLKVWRREETGCSGPGAEPRPQMGTQGL